MWEVISAISGAISAICDICGAGQHAVSAATENRKNPTQRRLHSFVLRSAGWCLTVLSFVCIEQPYGNYITDHEYKELLGWIVAGPAFLIIVPDWILPITRAEGRRLEITGYLKAHAPTFREPSP